MSCPKSRCTVRARHHAHDGLERGDLPAPLRPIRPRLPRAHVQIDVKQDMRRAMPGVQALHLSTAVTSWLLNAARFSNVFKPAPR